MYEKTDYPVLCVSENEILYTGTGAEKIQKCRDSLDKVEKVRGIYGEPSE